MVDPQLRHAGPNGFDVTRIAADEAFHSRLISGSSTEGLVWSSAR
jgi:hypothetical protein